MFVKPSSAFVEKPSLVASSSGSAKKARYARLLPSTRKSSESRAGPSSSWSSAPVSVFGIARRLYPGATLSPAVAVTSRAVPRVPLLYGSSVVVANLPDGTVVLRPPLPREVIADVGAAVREAVRFPLEGPPLASLARRGRATIVVEPPSLPIPGGSLDPRQDAVEAVCDELEANGIPMRDQTLLVAGGLARRAGPADTALLVGPEFRRRFRGRVVVHDALDEVLVDVGMSGRTPLRVNRALVETDVVVLVTAAETVVDGGPSALVRAAGPDPLRASGCWSLLETAASQGWQVATALERAIAERVSLFGVSLVLNHPQLVGTTLREYPFSEDAVERVVETPLRRAFSLLPRPLRRSVLRSLRREITAAGVYAGPPAVAHAEALLRAIAAR